MNCLLNAARGYIPMSFAAGRTPTAEVALKGHRSLDIRWIQEMYDQAAMTREAVKWNYELRNGEQVATIVDRALSVAMPKPRDTPVAARIDVGARKRYARRRERKAAGAGPRGMRRLLMRSGNIFV